MHIKGIDYPEPLLRARDSGELVVFAGAGVSLPAPSNLPLFRQLAMDIGKGTGLAIQNNEPEDRFLGRLEKTGVHVHQAARSFLVGPHTKPNSLHNALVSLFPDGKLRLVTTNFDTHFTTVANSLPGPPPIYYGPTLPLGDDFTGIVYLHGSAHGESTPFILTDRDFGEAYLTRGWATRFLASMFSRYHVLFIGYSHNDVVMNYLARGLPPETVKARYSFSEDNPAKISDWEFRGIKPIKYRRADDSDPHSTLRISIEEWSAETRRGIFDRARRIQALADGEPPIDPNDSDYVVSSLLDRSTARHFFSNAKSSNWINWIEEKKLLANVLRRDGPPTPVEDDLAFWMVGTFIVSHCDSLLALIEKTGGHPHPRLCWFIWRELASRKNRPDIATVFSKWVAFLVTQPPEVLQPDDWCSLLNECSLQNEAEAAIALFAKVTTPVLIMNRAWYMPDPPDARTVEFDSNLVQTANYWLQEFWERAGGATWRFEDRLLSIAISHISSAHTYLALAGRASNDYDRFYLYRQSIAEKTRDDATVLDILIDVCIASFRRLVEADPLGADASCQGWLRSSVPIVRRLGIWAFGRLPNPGADEKLIRIIDRDWLFTFKTDVFDLLKHCYPSATAEAKERFIRRVFEGPTGSRYDRWEQRSKDYEVYNVFVWLEQIAPECSLTKAAAERSKVLYPEFAPRERPDLDFESRSGSGAPEDTFDLDLISTTPARDHLTSLLACQPRGPFEKNETDYADAAAAVISRNPDWGFDWISSLEADKQFSPYLWECATRGWSNAKLEERHWIRILSLSNSSTAPKEFLLGYVDVLLHGIDQEEAKLPASLMHEAQQVAEKIWQTLFQTTGDVQQYDDWLSTAINRKGGRLAQFWVRRVIVAWEEAARDWQSIPAKLLEPLLQIIGSGSAEAVYGRIVFASRVHIFYKLDRAFAVAHLIPLFKWDRDHAVAEQSWDGFLFWGHWLPELSAELLPEFAKAIDFFQSKDHAAQRIVQHLADLTLFVVDPEASTDWLQTHFRQLNEKNRVSFAQQIAHTLAEVDVGHADVIWDRALRSFWDWRALGIPSGLSRDEAIAMIDWTLNLDKHFAEGVERVKKIHADLDFSHMGFVHRMNKRKLGKRHPDATAELFRFYLMRNPKYFHLIDDVKELWSDLNVGSAKQEVMTAIREKVYSLTGVDLNTVHN
jgi:hypothetical protein